MNRDLQNFNELVDILSSLPGIGKKSAMRMAYSISVDDRYSGARLAHTIEKCISSVTLCSSCGALTEHELCDICSDESRDSSTICLVESPKDIFLIETLKSFNGKYFVYGENNSAQKLKERVVESKTREIIFAFSPSIASDGLILYIEDKLKELDLEFTQIAQGVPGGISLENVDALSLSRALEKRVKV